MKKRLYRSRKDRMVWGVCGGLAEYFNIDPVIVRLVFVLLIFADGLGILAYIVMAIIFPSEEKLSRPSKSELETIEGAGYRRRVLGIILIITGILILIANFFQTWWLEWINIWPLIIVGLGLLILILNARR